jgi:hypothetical protein
MPRENLPIFPNDILRTLHLESANMAYVSALRFVGDCVCVRFGIQVLRLESAELFTLYL